MQPTQRNLEKPHSLPGVLGSIAVMALLFSQGCVLRDSKSAKVAGAETAQSGEKTVVETWCTRAEAMHPMLCGRDNPDNFLSITGVNWLLTAKNQNSEIGSLPLRHLVDFKTSFVTNGKWVPEARIYLRFDPPARNEGEVRTSRGQRDSVHPFEAEVSTLEQHQARLQQAIVEAFNATASLKKDSFHQDPPPRIDGKSALTFTYAPVGVDVDSLVKKRSGLEDLQLTGDAVLKVRVTEEYQEYFTFSHRLVAALFEGFNLQAGFEPLFEREWEVRVAEGSPPNPIQFEKMDQTRGSPEAVFRIIAPGAANVGYNQFSWGPFAMAYNSFSGTGFLPHEIDSPDSGEINAYSRRRVEGEDGNSISSDLQIQLSGNNDQPDTDSRRMLKVLLTKFHLTPKR